MLILRNVSVKASGSQSFTAKGIGTVAAIPPGMTKPIVMRALYTPDDSVNTMSGSFLVLHPAVKECLTRHQQEVIIQRTDGDISKIPIHSGADRLEYIDMNFLVLDEPILVPQPAVRSTIVIDVTTPAPTELTPVSPDDVTVRTRGGSRLLDFPVDDQTAVELRDTTQSPFRISFEKVIETIFF